MLADLIITDLTNMHAERICVAGINDRGQTIRPLLKSRHLTKDWCCQCEPPVQPFSKIQVDLLENLPQPPHTEDWNISEDYFVHYGVVPKPARRKILTSICDASVQKIFNIPIHHVPGEGTYVPSGRGERSLGTIKPASIGNFSHDFLNDNWDYRVSFEDATGEVYRLKIVDLTFQNYVDSLRNQGSSTMEVALEMNRIFEEREIFLRVGLARKWGRFPDRCYLQITGVYSFQK